MTRTSWLCGELLARAHVIGPLPAATPVPYPSEIESPRWINEREWIQWIIQESNGAALGPAIAVIGSFLTALAALVGVWWTIRHANSRAQYDREAAEYRATRDRINTDEREREASRHERFSRIVDQLSSEQSTVRMGGLFSLSALADEWQKEFGKTAPVIHFPTPKPGIIIRLWRWPRRTKTDGTQESPDRKEYGDKKEDALGQRDVCIELLCSYLRADPIGMNDLDRPNRNARTWAKMPETMPDRNARNAAISILKEHTSINARYPWPTKAIRLNGAHLEGADIKEVDLSGTDLRKVHLDGASIRKSILTRASLEGATFTYADLHEVQLIYTVLWDTDFSGAKIFNSDLRNSVFLNANLVKAEIWANCTETVFAGADLSGADLSKAKLAKSKSGDEVKLHLPPTGSDTHNPSAKWDDQTIWPAQFFPQEVVDRQRLYWEKVLGTTLKRVQAEPAKASRTKVSNKFFDRLKRHVRTPK